MADYAHVPDGPGVMLIGHEADRSLDLGEGRPGVLYQRKRDGEGSLEDRFAAAITAADGIADELEADAAAGGVALRPRRDPAEGHRPAPRAQRRRHAGRAAPGHRGGARRPSGPAATPAIARVTEDPDGPFTDRG